ncbi:MAG: bifunctional glutamate N-acetyltransferase/amino-acid acetyltransferase ArgJ [Alphaproteobacteria bacterium]|nr:bifunctional glutamate N-acetyltransferase/amino-acid acetyltransferase ArgJ [Alphaproteobacteria bacterium]
MSHPVSPLAPAAPPNLPALAGIRLATGAAGIRYKDRTDVLLVEMAPGTAVAGVFTKSLTRSAPVDWCKQSLAKGSARALVVNAGNANAFTGKAGEASVERTVKAAAQLLGCATNEVYVASTGVIGEPMADDRLTAALPTLRGQLNDDWAAAARAIMTTDTYPKAVTRTARIDGVEVRLQGIIKGSGMIQPDMATMLGFIFTDAAVAAPALQTLLTRYTPRTFNSITVDSDTSTSDTVLLFATGRAGHAPIADAGDARLGSFRRALEAVMRDLALLVVKDGEGVERLVTLDITGAATERSARRIGLAIANSPLVKTAIAAGDANWGRIVMAVGKSGEKADRDKLSITIGGVAVAKNGARVDSYDEGPVAAHMAGRDIRIGVDVGIGRGKATVWTGDLTHRYIDINGSYRS